jgi:hypothetical protein
MTTASCKVSALLVLILCSAATAIAQDNIFNFNYKKGGKQPRAGVVIGLDGVGRRWHLRGRVRDHIRGNALGARGPLLEGERATYLHRLGR